MIVLTILFCGAVVASGYNILNIPPRMLPLTHIRNSHDRVAAASSNGDVGLFEFKPGHCLFYRHTHGVVQGLRLHNDYFFFSYLDTVTSTFTSVAYNIHNSRIKEITSQIPIRHSAITKVGYETMCISILWNGAYTCFNTDGHQISGNIPIDHGVVCLDVDNHYIVTCDGTNQINFYDFLHKGKLVNVIQLPVSYKVVSLVLEENNRKILLTTSNGNLYELTLDTSDTDPCTLLDVGVQELRRGSGFEVCIVKKDDNHIGISWGGGIRAMQWKEIHNIVDMDMDDVDLVWTTGHQVFTEKVQVRISPN
jgi:hypothetical protein